MSVLAPEIMELDVGSDQGAKEYVVTHRTFATANPSVDTIFDVAAALQLAGFYDGAQLVANPKAYCRRVRIRTGVQDRRAGKWAWSSTSTFSTRTDRDPAGMGQEDPTQKPMRLSIKPATVKMPALWDEDDNPVANSAGDPVRRERDWSKLQITIDKTMAAFDMNKMLEAPDGFMHSRNEGVWNPCGPYAALFGYQTVPAGAGRVEMLTADLVFENGSTYVDVHLEVEVDTLWHHEDRFWDEGFRGFVVSEAADVGFELVQLQDPRTGMFPSKPIPLDGNGQALEVGEDMVELAKQYYFLKDWDGPEGLGLP